MIERTESLLLEQQQIVYKQTDSLFAWLLVCEWLASCLIAACISPRSWAGSYSTVHIHIWTAIFLGGLIVSCPIFLATKCPGKTITRHSIAVGQMLYSALLIHLTGGRIESHFHVFGSLAFLSFYRDWRVLISASIIVVADHLLRGFFFPQSVYGVTTIEPWRWLEHAWWVIFEDIFLIRACVANVREMRLTARRQAQFEELNSNIEELVRLRTEELSSAKLRLSVQYAVARILTENITWNRALEKILRAIATSMLSNYGRVWCAYWSHNNSNKITCFESLQLPKGSLDEFARISYHTSFTFGKGLPGRIYINPKSVQIEDVGNDSNLPRLKLGNKFGLSSAIGFPVTNRDQVIGVIEFWTEHNFQMNDDIIEMLQSLGQQIGQFAARKQIETERKHLAKVVQYSSDAIFTKTSDSLITSWNRGAERLFGYSAKEVKGQHISILIPDDKLDELVLLNEKTNNGVRIDNYETVYKRKDGKLIDVAISWTPIPGEFDNQSCCSVIVHDITERREAEKRVKEFYSVVSHELRSPLTSIRGVLGLIEGSIVKIDSSEAMELVEIARGSTDRLIRLINDMLDLKKIEAGKMELQRSKIQAEDLVSGTLYSLKALSEESGIQLECQTQTDEHVYADWDKCIQVLTNLVSNAIKFSPIGSQVTIMAKDGLNKRVRFCIMDKGPGISTQDIPKLFNKFQQLDSSDSRQKGGTGLGLAISKALVEEHGGIIGVESIPGKGSNFWFELPIYCEEEHRQVVAA